MPKISVTSEAKGRQGLKINMLGESMVPEYRFLLKEMVVEAIVESGQYKLLRCVESVAHVN